MSAPFALNATLREHFISNYQESDPEFVYEVLRQLYVDDFVGSKNSVTETFELFQKLKNPFKEGGFDIRKCATNDEELEKMIENYERLNLPSMSDSKLESAQMPEEPGQQLPLIEDDLSYSQTIFNTALNSDDVVKFLGTLWKRKDDVLRFDFLELTQNTLKAPVRNDPY